ncbi:MAG: hypothetical protein K8T25_08450 [Planctomycetia bacterium]|nr:hypothetical protein [Planctomycetia bacterium]
MAQRPAATPAARDSNSQPGPHRGRQVTLLTIGTGPTANKPAVLIVGNVEAAQLVGSELAMRIARLLAKRAENDKSVQQLLDQYTIYIIPRPNPDGSEKCWRRPYQEPQGNDRRTDDDRDGEIGEDGPDDLDGNGWITMMRIADPAGEYMPHPADARIMIKADPRKNERGQYRLMVEGIDNDHDGQWNEDGSAGVSFNRNFTFRYPYFQAGAGPNQVSEIETRAVADFAFDHPNIAAVFTFTPEDNLLHPWKPDAGSEGRPIKTHIMSADAPYQDYLAERYRKILGRDDAPDSPAGAGSFSEWAYFHYGRWSLGARAWWIPAAAEKKTDAKEKTADTKEKKKGDVASDAKKPATDTRGADDLAALRWLKSQGIDGFVDWHPIKHPDFPNQKVEVGGFKPFYRLNPPAKELDALGEKHCDFIIDLLGRLPHVKLNEVKVEPLGANTYRITATAINSGYLSTVSEMGRIAEKDYPVQIELSAPKDTDFLQGNRRSMIGKIEGEGGKVEQVWTVRFPKQRPENISVRIWAPAVGADEKKVSLK